MRISDWSSDVCSSDLNARLGKIVVIGTLRIGAAHHFAVGLPAVRDRSRLVRPVPTTADRQSVVEGKSVSVRVDLGGRRIITKKNTVNIGEDLLQQIKDKTTQTQLKK